MEKNKKFAWIPVMTEDKELVWLKTLNFEEKNIDKEYHFNLFGGDTSLSISYTKRIFSKIK